MNSKPIAVLCLCWSIAICDSVVLGRTWTSIDGHTAEAEYVKFADGIVTLKRTADGREVKVPLERLSQADRDYVAALNRPNPFVVLPQLGAGVSVTLTEDSSGLSAVSFGRKNANNDKLQSLSNFPGLRTVDISGSREVTDDGVTHLLSLENLAELQIRETGVTSAGVKRLAALSRLERLDLSGLAVDDDALLALTSLDNLAMLRLNDCSQVTDASLAALQAFPRLIELELNGTSITAAGLAELHESLKDCRIEPPAQQPVMPADAEMAAPPLATSVNPPTTLPPQQQTHLVDEALFGGANPFMIGVLAALGLALLGICLHFFLLVPRRKRKPLKVAYAIISADDTARFQEAESLLGGALTSGLNRNNVADARFALAYVRARLERYSDAATVLEELGTGSKRDKESVYLHLWVASRLQKHERVERLYDEHRQLLGDMLQTRLITAIAFLQRARSHWDRQEVEGATHYFAQIRELGVLTEYIPSEIDDQQIILGVSALFDKNIEEAEARFQSAVSRAKDEKNEESQRAGELGLLLCQWIKEDRPEIDTQLSQIVVQLEKREASKPQAKLVQCRCAHCRTRYTVNETYVNGRLACRECHRHFIVAERPQSEDEKQLDKESKPTPRRTELLDDADQFTRNIYLWHAVSGMFKWFAFKAQSGLPPKSRNEVEQRLNRVIAFDPDFGDPRMLLGLINYYFAVNEDDRTAAVKQLEEAQRRQVNTPEVINLIEREKQREKRRKDCLQRMWEFLEKYLADPNIAREAKEQVLARGSRFERFKTLSRNIQIDQDDNLDPASQARANAKLIHDRLLRIIKDKGQSAIDPQEAQRIDEQFRRLQRESESFLESLGRMDEVQSELVPMVTEIIFQDEEPIDPPDAVEHAADA